MWRRGWSNRADKDLARGLIRGAFPRDHQKKIQKCGIQQSIPSWCNTAVIWCVDLWSGIIMLGFIWNRMDPQHTTITTTDCPCLGYYSYYWKFNLGCNTNITVSSTCVTLWEHFHTKVCFTNKNAGTGSEERQSSQNKDSLIRIEVKVKSWQWLTSVVLSTQICMIKLFKLLA